MYKAAAVGDHDSIYGFAALGIDIFPAESNGEAESILRRLADGDYAIIYITEKTAAPLADLIEKYREKLTPAIILIPGASGNTGAGVAGVKRSVEQAVGADILFSKQ